MLGRLLQLQRTIVCRDSDLPDELLFGRAGYLYALLYVNTEMGPGAVCESAIKEVPRERARLRGGLARPPRSRLPAPSYRGAWTDSASRRSPCPRSLVK